MAESESSSSTEELKNLLEAKEDEVDEANAASSEASSTQQSTGVVSLGSVFLEKYTSMINTDSLLAIKSEQEAMYRALELANWKLSCLNSVSESTYQEKAAEFRQYIRSLQEMKKQLDSIFRRVRTLKAKVSQTYPEAYAAAQERISNQSDSDSVDR